MSRSWSGRAGLLALLAVGLAACGAPPAPAPPASSAAAGATPAPPPAPSRAPAAPALAGVDFAADARLLHRVLACAGEGPLPAGLDAPTVAATAPACGRS